MNKAVMTDNHPASEWVPAMPLKDLKAAGGKKVRLKGRQIALFNTPSGIRACNNLCPHEGYPLSEGSLSEDCTLTCNWHNWKFNLATGDNLLGGDQLRVYPVEVREGEIWINLAEPPFEQRRQQIFANLEGAFEDEAYERIAREITRLINSGGDPMDALRLSIHWSWQKLEFGWSHAYAGMADWLTLYDEFEGDQEARLVCLVESVAHCAFDVLREQNYPYPEDVAAYNEDGFVDAIEREDEALGMAMIRGALEAGLSFEQLEKGLARAALSHYNDFGHSIIYVTKIGVLIEKLGEEVAAPLLLSLVRSLIYATREDRIPEFRRYETTLDSWPSVTGSRSPHATDWQGKGINSSLGAALDSSLAPPEALYQSLLIANARNMLCFDVDHQNQSRVTVSDNVNWLDYTHGITFANAVRKQCSRLPELWPQGLLQMACFAGRNSTHAKQQQNPLDWSSGDVVKDLEILVDKVMDHGLNEYIVSVHLLKTALAAREEAELLSTEDGLILTAAVRRFFDSPLKRRQTRRTAYQSMQAVGREMGIVE